MVDIFPTRRFGFLDKEVDIERQTLKGGTALSGEQDTISTDGGGRVFAEFARGGLLDRDTNLGWRALMTLLEDGVVPMIVPFCDTRHTPYGPPGSGGVPHSDGTPFGDDGLYSANVGGAITASNYPLRGTSLRAITALARPLIGGEWFSITHPTKGVRAYRIARLVVTSDGPNVYDIDFRPPLREAVEAGEVLEFLNPACLMIKDGKTSSRVENMRTGEAAIRFIEAP